MPRITRLATPSSRSPSWKAALPLFGLAALCCAPNTRAAADASTDTVALVDFASCQKPVYPPAALEKHEQGTVTMSFDIDAEGHVTGARVERSSGSPDLDQEALGSIAKCAFKPATHDGTPHSSIAHVQYVWTTE